MALFRRKKEGEDEPGATTATGPAPDPPPPPPAPEPGAPPSGASPLSVDSEHDDFAQRPEVFVGAAFVGGFVAAQLLKRLRT